MLFYDGPRDITKHLQDFEQRFNLADYDHGKPELSGWRSEMKEAQIKQSGAEEGTGEAQQVHETVQRCVLCLQNMVLWIILV